MIKGEKLYLRAIEPEDLDFVYYLENQPEVWEVSDTFEPLSRYVIKQYLESAHLGIYQTKQLRFLISLQKGNSPIGLIDLYNFEPFHQRAGVGVVIDSSFQAKGYAKEALNLLFQYAFDYLQLNQLYASIADENVPSIKLFEALGFVLSGRKKQWNKSKNGEFKDELVYQKINTNK